MCHYIKIIVKFKFLRPKLEDAVIPIFTICKPLIKNNSILHNYALKLFNSVMMQGGPVV